MLLLCSADVHGNHAAYEWLLRQAHEQQVDALVLAGDLLGCPDGFETPEDAQRADAAQLCRLLDRPGLPVFYVMGNDDLVELGSISPSVRSVHGRKVQAGGISFVGYQYSLPFMGGTFERPEPAIASDLAALVPLLDHTTVLLTHSPAFGILDPGIGGVNIGSTSLRTLLDDHPCQAHIHGHSHGGFGRCGNRFNVAAAGRCRAVVLDLETMEHRVLGSTSEQG
jgi:Icc-related predicted phosphoesterase